MRAIWKGQISFGLINIPIELFSAEKNKELQFKLVDNRNKAKIRYERVNVATGKEVPWNEIVKAYEVKNKGLIVVTEEDFKRAAVENTQTFEIEDFIEQEGVELSYFEKPYYLVPTRQGEKGYVLLRDVLQKTKKIAIGKVVIRTRQYLAALLPQQDMLVLNLMRFSDELRNPDELDIPRGSVKNYKITRKEIEMAEKLVESMTVTWNPKKYRDNYREALMRWIEKKARLGHMPLPAQEEQTVAARGAKVIDFMELLKKSIKKTEPKQQKRTMKTRSKAKKRA